MDDWSRGRYERIADDVAPAAIAVVEAASPLHDEVVVDVGCGTGTAALLAARRDARVIGVDPAARLVDVARRSALDQGVRASFMCGSAEAVSVRDHSIDVLLSNFGVIFASDAAAAAAEISRIVAPGGRVVFSAWHPFGALFDLADVRRAAMPASRTAAPFRWDEPDALAGLFGPYGFEIAIAERTLAFAAPSIEQFAQGEFDSHPMWIAARELLEPRGDWSSVRERALAVLRDANEDANGFRITSPYVVAMLRR
jgi:SAM-dependent methyltransferase